MRFPKNQSSMEIHSSSDPKYNKSINGAESGAVGIRSRKCRNICIGLTVAIIVIVLLIVILAFTVFKAKNPITEINSVSLADLDFSLNMAGLSVNINVTLIVNLSIKNPNKVGLKYSDTTALLNYRGEFVGEAPIPADKISAGQKKEMNITLTIMADRLIGKSTIYRDVISGSIPFNTFTRVSGKVSILGIKIHIVSTTSCDFSVDISSRNVGDRQCNYRTKI